VIICPTIDTPDGKGWRCAPGTDRLRCACGSDDILSVRSGTEEVAAVALRRHVVIRRGVPIAALCEACFVEACR
jgi:hypothetical protein